MSAEPYYEVAPITDACPSWCTEHFGQDPGEEPMHWTRLEVGGFTFTVCEEEGRPAIITDDYLWMHLPDVRAYAAALAEACDRLEASSDS